MATVYLARDLKHRRSVAVKVLRPELAASLGADRFLHEIEIAAQLQHPHILPLLDSGDADGFLYYVMPYVEGESLRERLARTGELPVSEAVRLLADVVEALAYAHGRGVVHRDMKPENIMLSSRHPLVMDFGIAKAVSPTGTSSKVTTAGVALGTPAYMAPEQAAADPHLDHRVDIYALGVIGYELLSGSPPFLGTSAHQVLAAHMTHRPEHISTRRPTIPVGLATIIMRCLEKRPADRPQTADEIVRTLEAMITPAEGVTPTGSRPVPKVSTTSARWPLWIAGAILTAVLVAVLWRGRGVNASASAARHTRLTYLGNIVQQQISPDGELLAYVEEADTSLLNVKDLRAGSVIPIAVLGENNRIQWSPDGTAILATDFKKGKWVMEMFPRLGGPARTISAHGFFGIFSPDGSRLASWFQNSEPGITVTTLTTGAKRVIKWPQKHWLGDGDWSRDGRFIALVSGSITRNRHSLWFVDMKTGLGKEVVSDTLPLSPPRWAPGGGALYYIRNDNELCKIFLTSTGVVQGSPHVLQSGLGAWEFNITADGSTLTYAKRSEYSNIWRATKSPKDAQFTTIQLTEGTTWKSPAQLSPDGALIAFNQGEESHGDIFVLATKGGVPRRLTSSGVASSPPAWSRDGRHIAFVATAEGKRRLRSIALDGGEESYEKVEVSGNLVWAPYDRILYQRVGNRNFHWLNRTTGAEEPLVTNDSVGWIFWPIPSPDKKTLAVFWNRKPQRGAYLISLQDGTQTAVGPPNGRPLGWSANGNSIYVETASSHRIHRVPVRSGTRELIGTNPFRNASCDLTEQSASITLLCNVETSLSDVWKMENFDPTLAQNSR